jgi:uncharacterized protein
MRVEAAVDLFELVRTGAIADLHAALSDDPSAARDANGEGASLLSFAAYMGNADAIAAIRAALTEITPYEAIIVGDTSAVRLALEAGWDPNALAPDGFSPLGLAVFFRHPDVFDLLLPATANVNQRAENGQQVAALHAATAVKDAAAVEKLLRAGADPNLPQQQGFRPIHVSAMHGDTVITALLMLFGADPALTTESGKTAVDHAHEGGHDWLAARLL